MLNYLTKKEIKIFWFALLSSEVFESFRSPKNCLAKQETTLNIELNMVQLSLPWSNHDRTISHSFLC